MEEKEEKRGKSNNNIIIISGISAVIMLLYATIEIFFKIFDMKLSLIGNWLKTKFDSFEIYYCIAFLFIILFLIIVSIKSIKSMVELKKRQEKIRLHYKDKPYPIGNMFWWICIIALELSTVLLNKSLSVFEIIIYIILIIGYLYDILSDSKEEPIEIFPIFFVLPPSLFYIIVYWILNLSLSSYLQFFIIFILLTFFLGFLISIYCFLEQQLKRDTDWLYILFIIYLLICLVFLFTNLDSIKFISQ
ncbi:MAG: hypothetical protein FWE80_03875 [Oscillospiraceae bacterium]|nr:hypothetical protein [Oscillospiraceae bacterium]